MAGVTVGRVKEIPIRLHWSFLLALPFFAFLLGRAFFAPPGAPVPAEGWAWGAGLAVGLFGSVLVHELAHSLVALREGVPVKSITLLPIGGVSAFERLPKEAGEELRITAAGPVTNFVIGIPLLALAWTWGWPAAAPTPERFVFALGVTNVVLGGFNLFVPAFPMDGGRLLRAALTRPLGRAKATHVAALIGRGLAVLMGLWGLFSGAFLLALIAVFIYLGAGAEERAIRVEESLGRFRVRDLMTEPVETLRTGASVEDALRRMQETKHLVLPVVDEGGGVRGVVRLSECATVAGPEQSLIPVDDVLVAEFPRMAPDAPATEVAERIAAGQGAPVLVVAEDGRLAGIVTPTDVERFVAVEEARFGRFRRADSRGS